MSTLHVNRGALQEAGRFFEDRGQHGLEGTAMLAGPAGIVNRCVIPEQIGRRAAAGISVEVTLRGKLQLAGALAPDERYHARIHSHPREAFHSDTDDRNPGLTSEGALSIVVPNFGSGLRDGLHACAIYERLGARWVQLGDRDARDRLIVIG